MSLDHDYPNRKDRRRRYYGSKAFDHQCRNHGSCTYCERNRTINYKRVQNAVNIAMLEYKMMLNGAYRV